MTDQLAIHLTNARHHLDTAEHHQWEAIKPIVAALGHLYDAVHALAEPAVSPAAVALVSAGHHPADPDAADRVTAFLDAFADPAHPQGAISTLRSEGLRLTVTDLREVLAQRADARQRSQQLADKCAAYRARIDELESRGQ